MKLNYQDHPDFPIISTLQNIYFPQYGEIKSQGDNLHSTGDCNNPLITAIAEENGDAPAPPSVDPAPIQAAAMTAPRAPSVPPPPPPTPPPPPSLSPPTPPTAGVERAWKQRRGRVCVGRHDARGRNGRAAATSSCPVDPNNALLYINCINRIPKGFV